MYFRLSMAVIFFPMLAGLLLYLIGRLTAPASNGGRPAGGDPTVRWIALVVALLTLGGSLALAKAVFTSAAGKLGPLHLPWVLGHAPQGLPASSTFGFNLLVDPLAAIVLLIFATLVSLAITCSFRWFKDGGTPGYYALMLIFLGGMNGVALANDVIQFYFFWELMLIPSWLLLTFWGEAENLRAVSLKYFIFTHVGAVLMLVGLLLSAVLAGTTDMSLIQARLSALLQAGSLSPDFAVWLAWLIAAGFLFKMAIVPFHTWLPDAYVAAPMPVTVTLAAAMINTGVYGMIRFLFGVVPAEAALPLGLPFLVLAVISQYYGGLMAFAEGELKRTIAYSSISQMGYMLFGIGASLCLLATPGASAAGLGVAGTVFHMINHGLGKAILFLVVGAVAAATGARYFTEVGGLAVKQPALAFWATAGALTLVGAPPLAGFASEWMIFGGGFGTPHLTLAILACGGTILTAAYCLWFVKRVFYGPEAGRAATSVQPPEGWHVALGLLAGVSLLVGVFPAPFFAMVKGAVGAFQRLPF